MTGTILRLKNVTLHHSRGQKHGGEYIYSDVALAILMHGHCKRSGGILVGNLNSAPTNPRSTALLLTPAFHWAIAHRELIYILGVTYHACTLHVQLDLSS